MKLCTHINSIENRLQAVTALGARNDFYVRLQLVLLNEVDQLWKVLSIVLGMIHEEEPANACRLEKELFDNRINTFDTLYMHTVYAESQETSLFMLQNYSNKSIYGIFFSYVYIPLKKKLNV